MVPAGLGALGEVVRKHVNKVRAVKGGQAAVALVDVLREAPADLEARVGLGVPVAALAVGDHPRNR